jgi:NCAIR mutase (PurE)-related protein
MPPVRSNSARSGARVELRVGGYARFDLGRPDRTGIPEVILAEGKRPEQVVGILRALQRAGRGALVSRVDRALETALTAAAKEGLSVRLEPRARLAVLAGPLADPPGPDRIVAILTAGTADIPVAEEARVLLESAGARVVARYDVGVAGLAGREGALPTVVAGLVRAPVIGVPTSQGYGRGGRGEAALNAMLQSCAALAVVNIDGGIPAALFALQLLASSSNGHTAVPPSLRGSHRRRAEVSARTL